MALKVPAEQIERAMRADRFRLSRWRKQLDRKQREGKSVDRELAKWDEALKQSQELVERRVRNVPAIEYDTQLPITAKLPEIRDAIQNHQVVIVCGETGSGKSTQLPKLCLEMGLAADGLIGHTQPRRLAARTIASRLSSELATAMGSAVGFKIRFTDETKPTTYIKLMTDGILLAETQSDRFFEQYNVLIIDEAHERSLNIDFLLGYIKRLLSKRPELKLIITSATIDAERFQAHFSDPEHPAPIIEVSGRGYPVEIVYRAPEEEANEQADHDLMEAVGDAVEEAVALGEGDGLVFLPTEQDIRAAAKHLRGRVRQSSRLSNVEILPLYARLPTQEQNRVFEPHAKRRVVLATNVAESSLTVPGIRFVVDTGTARISRYSPRSKVQRLPIEAISRASADQRAGRCGRIGPGVCVRLYSEEDYQSRDAYTTPEIRRTNLASVILTAKALRLGEIDDFPFLDPPHPESIRDGYRTLFELGAIDDQRELTELGRRLARLPVDPCVGRMILAADAENCLHEMLIIASGLEIQDPRDRPPEKQEKADAAHAQFQHPESDFMSLLKVWDFYHQLKGELSQNRLRKACVQNFLSFQRMRQWLDVHRQLLRLAKDSGLTVRKRGDDYRAIHTALLTGLLSGVAMKVDRHEYLGARNVKFFLWPGSGIFESKPTWLIAAEVIETTRRFGRTAAKIEPEWIEPVALHVVKRSYSDPHWHRKSARCMAFEKVSLFGLPIVPKRRVPYGPIDPVVSRQIMIEHGLVGGEYEGSEDFLVHNRLLVEEIEELRAKTRRREFVIDNATLEQFYEDRLPADVCDARSLREAIRRQGKELEARLTMQREDLVPGEAEAALAPQQFPPSLDVGGMKLNLDYRFEPGAVDDGVTLTVPMEGFRQLDRRRLEWSVPGLLEEQVVALIRSLPKRIRRNLTPAPETAREVVRRVTFGEGEFVPVIAEELSRIAGEKIPVEEFDFERRPEHLRLHVRVIDDEGKAIAEGRDLSTLQQELGVEGNEVAPAIEDDQWTQEGLTDWSFDELPKQVSVRRGGFEIPSFPALLDEGETVAMRLLPDAEVAKHRTRYGIMRLLALNCRKDLRSMVKWLPNLDRMQLWAATRLKGPELVGEIADLIALRVVDRQRPLPRTREAWQQLMDQRVEEIGLATQEIAKLLPELFENYHQAQVAVEETNRTRFGEALADVRRQLSRLIYPGFLLETPWEWLAQYPRYLRAIGVRLEKLAQLGAKDREYQDEIEHYWRQYEERVELTKASHAAQSALVEYRWMIEEYRVSLFAQQLGTYVTISPTRLEKQWAKVMKQV